MKYTILNEDLYLRFLEAYREFYIDKFEKEPGDVFWSNFVKFVSVNLHNPNCLFLLAVDGKKVKGFVIMEEIFDFEGEKTAFIHHFYVSPKARGKNVGLNLLNIAKGWLKQKGFVKAMYYEDYGKEIFNRKKRLVEAIPKKILYQLNLQGE